MPTKRSSTARPAKTRGPSLEGAVGAGDFPAAGPSASPQSAPAAAAPVLGIAVPPSAPPVSASLPSIALPYPSGWFRVLAFGLAFCQPGLGLAFGLLYLRGPDRRTQRFSRWCLGLAVLGALALWAGGLVWAGMQNAESTVQAW